MTTYRATGLREELMHHMGLGGDSPALVDLDGTTTSYVELTERAVVLSNTLDALSGEPGVVCVKMRPSPEAVVTVLAVLLSQHGLAPLHPDEASWAEERAIAALRPLALITDGGISRPDQGPPFDRIESPRQLMPDTALLALTSGSTGAPKAIVVSSEQMAAALDLVDQALGYRREDCVAAIPPLSFDYGLYQIFLCAWSAATLLVDPRIGTVQGALRAVKAGATILPLVPPFLRLVLRSGLVSRVSTDRVRLITTTGDFLHDDDADAARKAFPNAEVIPMYGLTECKRVAVSERGVPSPSGAVGRPLPAGDVAVVDDHGRRLAPGEPGELMVAGPHLARGYLDDPEATRRRFEVDTGAGIRTLRTGDRLSLEDDGWLRWRGRAADTIKTSGFRVEPAGIESVVKSTGVVADVVVHGRPDELRGQVPVALILPKPGVGTDTVRDELRRALDARLPRWAKPELEFISEPLPRTANGKLSRVRSTSPDERREDQRPTRAPSRLDPLAGMLGSQFINCHSQAFRSAYSLGVTAEWLELLTTTPFGVRAEPDDLARLLVPFIDPDTGLDRAAKLLGHEIETVVLGPADAAEAGATLDRWLRTGPVVLGPLDLGHLRYHPLRRTLVGCDHYVVALGRSGDRTVVRDPEGFVQISISSSQLMEAWRADRVPEGRGAYTMRRLLRRPEAQTRDPRDVLPEVRDAAVENIMSASRCATGGSNAYRSLQQVDPTPGRSRSLCLLVPPMASRYRLAAAFFGMVGTAGDLAGGFGAQAVRLARLAGALLLGDDDPAHLEELVRGEDLILDQLSEPA